MLNICIGISLIGLLLSGSFIIQSNVMDFISPNLIELTTFLIFIIICLIVFTLFRLWKIEKISKVIIAPLAISNILLITDIILFAYNSSSSSSIEEIINPSLSITIEPYLQFIAPYLYVSVFIFVMASIIYILKRDYLKNGNTA